jgi:CDP-diacylglycerol--glycerol-3-phosphate 3-phosphatidyltransferase
VLGPADQLTLARLVLAPLAVASYLLVPLDGGLCFWVTGIICGIAELTDWLDGRVARARGEVSDFGKLADPFCDVFYRIALFVVMLLPANGLAYPVAESGGVNVLTTPLTFALADGSYARGFFPFVPVLIMVLREVVAGALRSMSATKGLVLAARMSGKVKAWFQGTLIVTALGLPAVFGMHDWHLEFTSIACWVCAALSAGSMIEYIWVNRPTLSQLVERRARDN